MKELILSFRILRDHASEQLLIEILHMLALMLLFLVLFISDYPVIWFYWYFYFFICSMIEWRYTVARRIGLTDFKDFLSNKVLQYFGIMLIISIVLKFSLFPMISRYSWAFLYHFFELFGEILSINDILLSRKLSIIFLLFASDFLTRMIMLIRKKHSETKKMFGILLRYFLVGGLSSLLVFMVSFSLPLFGGWSPSIFSSPYIFMMLWFALLYFLSSFFGVYKNVIGIDFTHL